MNYNLFIESTRRECQFLEKAGYTFREVDRNIWYEKEEGVAFRVSFAYTMYGDVFHVKALRASKRFNRVERIIQDQLKYDFKDYYTIHISPQEVNIPPNLPFTKTSNN